MGIVPPAAAVPANSGVLYYVHNDPLGAPQALTDESGTVVWSASYDPFGQATVNADPDNDGNTVTVNVRFPGQYYDQETGLHYNYYRYYDPRTGRYITSDPIGLTGGINLYTYVANNPLSFIDPLGLAYFGKRPVGSTPDWLARGPGTNPVDDALNTELVHEQIFYEDGKLPSNEGFFGDQGAWNKPGTVRPDDPNRLKDYWRSDPNTYDDALMREAVRNTGAGNYCLIGSNCQDWAEKVRREYERLKREREKKCP